jgi:hypothetical protein
MGEVSEEVSRWTAVCVLMGEIENMEERKDGRKELRIPID